MKAMSKVFKKDENGMFRSETNPTEEMLLNWLRQLNIPSNATMLWFELSDVETADSLAVNVSLDDDDILLEVISLQIDDASTLYKDELIKGDFEKLRNDPLPLSYGISEKMYLRVWFR